MVERQRRASRTTTVTADGGARPTRAAQAAKSRRGVEPPREGGGGGRRIVEAVGGAPCGEGLSSCLLCKLAVYGVAVLHLWVGCEMAAAGSFEPRELAETYWRSLGRVAGWWGGACAATWSAVRRVDRAVLKDSLEQLRTRCGSGPVNAGGIIALLLFLVAAGKLAASRAAARRPSGDGLRGSPADDGDVTVLLSDGEEVQGDDSEAGSDADDSDYAASMEEDEDEEDSSQLRGDDTVYVSQRLTVDEYEKETERATSREVAKLLRSAEFRQLVKERGRNEEEFNWQKRRTSARLAEKQAPPATR